MTGNWINLTMGDGVFVLQASIVILIILYWGLVQESTIGADGRSPHSAWRNYDDFNEFFWYFCWKYLFVSLENLHLGKNCNLLLHLEILDSHGSCMYLCIYLFIYLLDWLMIYLFVVFFSSEFMTVVCVLFGDLIGHLLALRFHGHGDQMRDSLRNPKNSFILKLIDLWVNRFLPCFVSAKTQTFCVWKGKGKLFMFHFSLLCLRLLFFGRAGTTKSIAGACKTRARGGSRWRKKSGKDPFCRASYRLASLP